MKVFWRQDAERDLMRIVDYVMLDNPRAAIRFQDRVWKAALTLSNLPDRFRAGAEPDTRELVVPHTPYIITYRVSGDQAEVLSIFHAAQDKPRGG